MLHALTSHATHLAHAAASSSWVLAAVNGPDLGASILKVATYFAQFAGPVAGLYFVLEGIHYMTATDDPQKAMHAKRAIGAVITGLIFVVFATVLGPFLQSIV